MIVSDLLIDVRRPDAIHGIRLLHRFLLTDRVGRLLRVHMVPEALRKLLAVPHHQLLIGLDVLSGVKINVALELARDQIHHWQAVGRSHVAHPVGLACVGAVQVIIAVILKNLGWKETERAYISISLVEFFDSVECQDRKNMSIESFFVYKIFQKYLNISISNVS